MADKEAGGSSIITYYDVKKHIRRRYAFVCLPVLSDAPLHTGIYFLKWSVNSKYWATYRSLKSQTPSSDNSGEPGTLLLFSKTTLLKWECHSNGKKSSLTHWENEMCPEAWKIPSRLWVHTCWFESELCLSLAVWIWTLYLIFLSHSFLTEKKKEQ